MPQRISNWKALRTFLLGALCAPFASPGALPQIPAGLQRDLARAEARADALEREAPRGSDAPRSRQA